MRKIKRAFGILLILAGVLFYAYPSIQQWRMDYQTNRIIREFQEKYQDDEETESDDETGSEELSIEEPSTEESTEASAHSEYLDALYAEMQAYNENLVTNGQQLVDAWSYAQTPVDISGLSDGAIGYIDIPDMNLTMALYIGASTENMAKGAAVLSETSMPIGGENTNCVIAGHRGYSGMPYFKAIEDLTIGSMVYITNPWETLTYTVTDIQIILPNDVESILIQEGKDMVTLLTCHPYMSHGQYRYVVFCERMTEESTQEGNGETADGTGEKSTVVSEETDGSVTISNGIEITGSDTLFIQIESLLRYLVLIFLIIYALWCILKAILKKRKK